MLKIGHHLSSGADGNRMCEYCDDEFDTVVCTC